MPAGAGGSSGTPRSCAGGSGPAWSLSSVVASDGIESPARRGWAASTGAASPAAGSGRPGLLRSVEDGSGRQPTAADGGRADGGRRDVAGGRRGSGGRAPGGRGGGRGR